MDKCCPLHQPEEEEMSEFWVRKMRTYFDRIDFDKDGAITRADFEGMSQRFATSLSPEKAKALSVTLTAVWDKYMKSVGGGFAIKEDSFVASMKTLAFDPKMKDTLLGPLPLFFHAVDTNGDQLIDETEFASFFTLIGLDPKMAASSFQAIDDNGDGEISLEEFVEAGGEFFTSEDSNKPSKLFWGPLVL